MSCLRRTLWVKEPTRGEMGKVLVVGPSEHQAEGSRSHSKPQKSCSVSWNKTWSRTAQDEGAKAGRGILEG